MINRWISTLRIHQWVKNLLVFVPMIAAHRVSEPDDYIKTSIAFASFCFAASSIYLLNDLTDMENDRHHPRKKYRAITAGLIPSFTAKAVSLVLVFVSLFIAWTVGPAFTFWLALYIGLSLSYSLILKKVFLVDCMVLALLFTIRIVAGGAAVGIEISYWLLTFSSFIFLSLAFIKRVSELNVLNTDTRLSGRGYGQKDGKVLQIIGGVSGYLSVIILAFYIKGETAETLYPKTDLLWLAIPILAFWIGWMWRRTVRAEMHDDPVLFAIKDPVSLVSGILFGAAFVLAGEWR